MAAPRCRCAARTHSNRVDGRRVAKARISLQTVVDVCKPTKTAAAHQRRAASTDGVARYWRQIRSTRRRAVAELAVKVLADAFDCATRCDETLRHAISLTVERKTQNSIYHVIDMISSSKRHRIFKRQIVMLLITATTADYR